MENIIKLICINYINHKIKFRHHQATNVESLYVSSTYECFWWAKLHLVSSRVRATKKRERFSYWGSLESPRWTLVSIYVRYKDAADNVFHIIEAKQTGNWPAETRDRILDVDGERCLDGGVLEDLPVTQAEHRDESAAVPGKRRQVCRGHKTTKRAERRGWQEMNRERERGGRKEYIYIYILCSGWSESLDRPLGQ